MAASIHANGQSTAATPHLIALSPAATPGTYHYPYGPLSNDSAQLASKLLQKNHFAHNVFFNDLGFHNHIAHHLLTLFAIGARPSQIQTSYEQNTSYQRPQLPVQNAIVEDMRKDRSNLTKYLCAAKNRELPGTVKYYADLQEFFATEMDRLGGIGPFVNEYVFKKDEIADDIFTRLFSGLIHPLIHLGFGLEFHQPAIVAEALAQACVHDNQIAKFIHACEHAVSASKEAGSIYLVDILDEIRRDDKVMNSPHLSDENLLRDGVLHRAFDQTVSLVSQWRVKPEKEDIARKTAEMINFTAYFAGAAAFPTWDTSLADKEPKVDFFLMHGLNASIFFSSFAEDPQLQTWFSLQDQARLLQVKAWTDLALFISRGTPPLNVADILAYEPQSDKRGEEGWKEIFSRVSDYEEDDGHAVKLVRAVANGERVCKAYEGKEEWCVVRGEMWQKLGHLMVDSIDSVERSQKSSHDGKEEALYVRSAGFKEAWKDIPRKRSKLNKS